MISELASDKTCENNFKIGGGLTILYSLYKKVFIRIVRVVSINSAKWISGSTF